MNLGGARFVERCEGRDVVVGSIVKVFIATPFMALFAPKAKSIVRFASRILNGTFTSITR